MLDTLLQAVLADPGDDAARLVYADALLAAGDPRGELIVVEHRLLAEQDARLCERRIALRQAYGATWWPEVPTRHVRTRCGFAEAVAVQPRELPSVAPLFAREPVRELEIWGDWFDVGATAWLPDVARLVVRTATTPGLEALLASPVAAGLESLDIAGSGVHHLDLGDRLPACRRLVLAGCGFWIDDLLGWAHLGALRELDISVADVDADELAALLARMPEVQILRASGNLFGDAGGEAILAALPQLPHLAALAIIDCDIGVSTMQELRAAAPAIVIADDVPARIDLVGSVLELLPANPDWPCRVDGVRRPLSARGTTAMLALLANAVRCGQPRKLSQLGAVVRTPELTAHIVIADDTTPITIAFESEI